MITAAERAALADEADRLVARHAGPPSPERAAAIAAILAPAAAQARAAASGRTADAA